MGYNMLKIEPSSDRVAQPSFNPHCSKELAPCARAALVAQGKSLEGTAIPAGASRNRVLNSSDAPESERTAVKVSDLGDAGSKFTTELSATPSDLGCWNPAGTADCAPLFDMLHGEVDPGTMIAWCKVDLSYRTN